MNRAQRDIILDTDIGNDVDDIFALIMLAKSNGVRLRGVTTVYGDTALQAQMCRFVLDKLGRIDVPVLPGEGVPIGGGAILRGDHVGGGFRRRDLDNVRVAPRLSAVDFLVEQARLYDGSLELLTIGPLTNVARAIQKDPSFGARIKRITLMAGMIYPDENPEWLEVISAHNGEYNIACDLDASKVVFESGIPMTLVPLDVTTTVAFSERHKEYFSRMPHGLGAILSRELEIWWNANAKVDPATDCRSNPHDPMTVVAAENPEFFVFERGTLSIGKSHGLSGMTLFQKDESGKDDVAVGVDTNVLEEIVRRVIH